MRARTSAHLAKAEHHRAVAQALIGSVGCQISQSPPIDWAIIAAFYAAVHYVNAWLWERWQQDPGGHGPRSDAVWLSPELQAAGAAYGTLKDLGWQCRYQPFFTPST